MNNYTKKETPVMHDPIDQLLANHLLLIKRYILYKVLACSTTLFQLSLFCTTFFQLRTFMLFISSKTLSSQRVLGLPIGLLDMGSHLLIFCTLLSLAMYSTWPSQFSLCFFNKTEYILSFQYFVDFLISFNPPVAIIWSSRTKYFSS